MASRRGERRLLAAHRLLAGAGAWWRCCAVLAASAAGISLAWHRASPVDDSRGGRMLQADPEATSLTLSTIDTAVFSPPPYGDGERALLVYYTVLGVYVACAILGLVGLNLDQAERKKRYDRAIVPQEPMLCKCCCLNVSLPQDSVPCELTEQYYIDERLLSLRSPQNVVRRKRRMRCLDYVSQYAGRFSEIMSREHLLCSFFMKAIPTFTRVKRAVLILLQIHVCMLTAAMAFNIREHEAPQGSYEPLTCKNRDPGVACIATLPPALIAAVVICPFFRYVAVWQMRLTCMVSQSHPSTSRFPLRIQKFANLGPKTLRESILCMRNGYEQQKAHVTKSRSFVHRMVERMWKTTQSVNEVRFYSVLTSWCILTFMLVFIVATGVYVFLFTVRLKDSVAFHWLLWISTMFVFSVLVVEPLLIFWTDVLWCAFVANIAQYWGFGSHALAATTKYNEVIKNIDEVYLGRMRQIASKRIQRWWLAVLDMYRAIHEQTAAAIKIQAVRKKMNQKKRYIKERKWCIKVEVRSCNNLDQVEMGQLMSPFVRLQCDEGNPAILQTNVAWETGTTANFNETYYIDIKESNALYVSAWAKGLTQEEFVGRGYFDFSHLKAIDKDQPEGQVVKVALAPIQHGERYKAGDPQCGHVTLHVQFLDPLRNPCGVEGQEDWMLPKNRMKFALSKMNPGGRLKVGKMLGSLHPPSSSRAEPEFSNLAPSRAGSGSQVASSAAGSRPRPGGAESRSGGAATASRAGSSAQVSRASAAKRGKPELVAAQEPAPDSALPSSPPTNILRTRTGVLRSGMDHGTTRTTAEYRELHGNLHDEEEGGVRKAGPPLAPPVQQAPAEETRLPGDGRDGGGSSPPPISLNSHNANPDGDKGWPSLPAAVPDGGTEEGA